MKIALISLIYILFASMSSSSPMYDDPPIGSVRLTINLEVKKQAQVLLEAKFIAVSSNDLQEIGIGFENVEDSTVYFDPNAFDKLKEFLKRILDKNDITEWTKANISIEYQGNDRKKWRVDYLAELKPREERGRKYMIISILTVEMI